MVDAIRMAHGSQTACDGNAATIDDLQSSEGEPIWCG